MELTRRGLTVPAGNIDPREAGAGLWVPFAGPQRLAYESAADELFYGGAAGGGKTDLELGLAITGHRSSIIFRREYPQLQAIIERSREIIGTAGNYNANEKVWRLDEGRRVEFGAVQHEWDKQKYQGRPHDLKAFDELPHFTESQYRFLIAWNRTNVEGQRCRVVATGNPPVPGQGGEWITKLWAPWLDDKFSNPAQPGELRWFVQLGDEEEWVNGPDPVERDGKILRPRSRTFIKALVDDNPVYMATGYDAILEALPEPLRSQLRYGDFGASAEDHPWQVIPTAWVLAAQARWYQREPEVSLTALGADPSRGGKDKTVLAPRYGNYFGGLVKRSGKEMPDGPAVATLVVNTLTERQALDAAVNIDPIAVGSSPLDILRANDIDVRPVNFSAPAVKPDPKKPGGAIPLTDKSGKFKFRNVRAAGYWLLREALDPENGDDIALPDDRELLGDLCAPRYSVTTAGILLEPKEEIEERLGRSPDCGDAVVLAFYDTNPPPKRKLVFH